MTTDESNEPGEATGLADYFNATRGGRGDAALGASTLTTEQTGAPDEVSVVRSAERLALGTVTEAAERVRLRKFIVEEDVTTTVTVRREEVRLEQVPLTADDEYLDPDHEFSEVDYELVLFAERVVVSREVVPVERIRLGKTVVVEQEVVSEVVRSERVDVDVTQTDGSVADHRRLST